jgi:hypothetical protein
MSRLALPFLAAGVILSSCGCGTVCNLAEKEPVAFGGVQKDIQFIMTPSAGRMADSPASTHPGQNQVIFALVIMPAEVGLSCMADTLTWPFIVYLNHRNHPSEVRSPPKSGTKQQGESAVSIAGPYDNQRPAE